MTTYFAFRQDRAISNGFQGCLNWALQETHKFDCTVKIARARPGEKKARIVGEVDVNGFNLSRAGREIPVKTLVKATCLEKR